MKKKKGAAKKRAASAPTGDFARRLARLQVAHERLLSRPNKLVAAEGTVVDRYRYPVLTAAHTPIFWRFDLDPATNPLLLERMGVNSVFNPGAIKHNGKYIMVARVEGYDRKSFFALAESETGVDRWRFRDYPIRMPEMGDPDVNVYDMRLTRHQDGWIYGVFCTERKDPRSPGDPTAAVAQAGIARTRDLDHWERLPDLRTPSAQQRNVVLHPELVDGRYAFYTRPQEGFIETGAGGGIGWGLCEDIEHAVITQERLVDPRAYHTIKEAKNGLGPPPLKTDQGWIQLAHGVRNTAAGLRYVLYLFVTALDEPWRVTSRPGGYLMAPEGDERVGDVSNVLFSGGWIRDDDDTVFIYYGASDTRTHVARTSIARLLDYAKNTPSDPLRSPLVVDQRHELIRRNSKRTRGQSAVNPVATVASLEREMRSELTGRILPYWSERAVDRSGGGFYGYIGPDGVPDPDAPRAAILISRTLWTFSAAHRALGDPRLCALADRAADLLRTQFRDPTHGGVYRTVDRSGHPMDDRKHVYAQAFAVFGLAEHYRATRRPESLRDATALFRLIETQAHDAVHGGYHEAFSRDWEPLDDARLDDTDLNAPRSANTHLHLLEAYTTLHRAWPDPVLASRLRSLVELFLDQILDRTSGHLRPFFDERWTPRSRVVSYGHDIEASWLLSDAAVVLKDPGLSARAGQTALLLAEGVLKEGLDPMGGVFYLADPSGSVDQEKEWWTQAEAVVGFLNAYQETARADFLAAAWNTWAFIKAHMLNPRGEWYRRVDRDGTPQPQHEQVGPWKCPYHNGRACLEVMRRATEARR